MTRSTAQSFQEALDDEGRVAVDRFCAQCGYNLRSLPAESVCPECATPVTYSLRDWLLRFAPPGWLRKLARGLLLLLIAAAAMALFMVIMMVVGMIWVFSAMQSGGAPTGPKTVPFLISYVPSFVIAVLWFWGLWIFTTPEPRGEPPGAGLTARKLLRVLIWMIPFGFLMGFVWLFIPWGVMWSPLGWAISTVLGLVATILGGLMPVLVMRHLRGLLRRIPRPGLARFAQIEFWGLLGCLVLLAIGQTVLAGSTAQMTPALAGVNPRSTPWQTGGFPIGQFPSATTVPGGATAGIPSTTPTATTPATSLPAGFPGIGVPGIFLASIAQGCGSCAGLGFAVAGFVLLILAQRALAGVASQGAALAVAESET